MTGGQTCDGDGIVDKTFTGKSKFENARANSIVSRQVTGQSGTRGDVMRKCVVRVRDPGL
jgi:hypothetical protein